MIIHTSKSYSHAYMRAIIIDEMLILYSLLFSRGWDSNNNYNNVPNNSVSYYWSVRALNVLVINTSNYYNIQWQQISIIINVMNF